MIAIRIARSNTKKQNVAICGYHRQKYWYLYKFEKQKKLINIFKRLDTLGVLKNVKYIISSITDIKGLKDLIYKKILNNKMEVCRSSKPNLRFLKS